MTDAHPAPSSDDRSIRVIEEQTVPLDEGRGGDRVIVTAHHAAVIDAEQDPDAADALAGVIAQLHPDATGAPLIDELARALTPGHSASIAIYTTSTQTITHVGTSQT